MAVTRNFLKGMGLTEEQVGAIIDEHVDTVNSLKADRDKYKAEAEKLPGVQKELNDLKAKGDGGWEAKYEKEHSDFETYKTAQIAKESRAAKETAYTALLKEANISEKAYKLILNATNFDALELDEDGKAFKDAAKLSETIKADYADFVTTKDGKGADVPIPPENSGGSFEAMNLTEKMEYANAHPDDVQVKEWLK